MKAFIFNSGIDPLGDLTKTNQSLVELKTEKLF